MESTSGKRTVININETVKKHAQIVPSILPAHTLSGCDSVPQLFAIGKTKVVNTLKKSFRLKELGNLISDFNHILAESTSSICAVLWCKGRIEHVTSQVTPAKFSVHIIITYLLYFVQTQLLRPKSSDDGG